MNDELLYLSIGFDAHLRSALEMPLGTILSYSLTTWWYDSAMIYQHVFQWSPISIFWNSSFVVQLCKFKIFYSR